MSMGDGKKREKSAGNPADFCSVKGKAEVGRGICGICKGIKHGKRCIPAGTAEITAGKLQGLQNTGGGGQVPQKLGNRQCAIFTVRCQQKSIACIELKLFCQKGKTFALLNDSIFRQEFPAQSGKFPRPHSPQGNGRIRGIAGKTGKASDIPVAHSGIHLPQFFFCRHKNRAGITLLLQLLMCLRH